MELMAPANTAAISKSDTDQHWFAVQVKPRHEFKTSAMLRNKGLCEFVPCYSVRRQWSDRHKKVTLPLFTSYVFCKMDPKKKLPVITTAGVIRIVGSSQGPIPISDHEIETIQRLRCSGSQVQPYPYTPAFPPGSRMRIEEGPLTGIEGSLVRYKNRSVLLISVDLIQQTVSVEIEGSAVSLVKSEKRQTLLEKACA